MKPHFSIDFRPKLFSTLKSYDKSQFSKDFMAGIIVGVVAIPLAIAFGIASGVGPTEGLVTAIIAGFIISVFGGSKVQIGGPTGAFIVIIYGIIQQFGVGGLAIATIMAGIILVLMGIFRLGSVIKFMPYPIIVGFTGGIAITIFSTQMNDLFGLGITDVPANFIDKWVCYFHNIGNINWWAFAVGILSILIIIYTPKFSKKIPGSLLAIVVMTLICWLLERFAGVTSITTIGDLYQLPKGIPAWSVPTLPEGETLFSTMQSLLPVAFTIAMLGAIESLLSAMVADGVIGDRHNSNTELIGQGLGNIASALFGGIPATGAIARTAANVKNGGKTPVAGMVHAIVLLLILLVLMPYANYIPMPVIAAILFMVAYNMSEWRKFVSILKTAPKSDITVLLVTFFLTVIFDIVVAIEIGMIVSAVLFIKRMADVTHIRPWTSGDEALSSDDGRLKAIPAHTEVYEIHGPMFFATSELFNEIPIKDGSKVVIIRMRNIPSLDVSALRSLESAYDRFIKNDIKVIFSHVNKQPLSVMKKSGFYDKAGSESFAKNIDVALSMAKDICAQ